LILDKKGQSDASQYVIIVLLVVAIAMSGASLWITAGQDFEGIHRRLDDIEDKIEGIEPVDPPEPDEPFEIAALLPGDVTDRAWNQSMYESLMILDGMDEYDVDYTDGVYDAVDAGPHLRSFADAGYDLVIAHGFQYEEITYEVAEDYPDVHFLANAAGVYDEPLPNLAVGDVRTDEHGYIQGVLMSEVSETGNIGFLSGLEVAELARNHRGIERALDDYYPDVELHSVYTGDFHDVEGAREAVISLVEDQNVDAFCSVGDGVTRGSLDQAADEGIWITGPSVDWSVHYPDQTLTSAVWRWEVVIEQVVEDIEADDLTTDEVYWLSMRTDGIEMTEIHEEVPQDVVATVNEYIDQIEAGELLPEPLS